ncbi:hypothetical protein B0A48_10652 [Cryoendolithus antarcticus]|uniref:Apurinic-apyrimidinic endonuclease 1 n=1 Tax=Cryoendolithus antarcticus TaxID=1507870 RepID=A0A1V8SY58_9PEZI|nr:hypothetical protein B0A48_10652 [Cryoendolithus antarcticus]
MPKRKTLPDPSDEDSGLSSAPENIDESASLVVNAGPAISPPPAKKRKTTVKSKIVKQEIIEGDAIDGGRPTGAKPKRKAAAKKVKAEIVETATEEETVEGAADASETPKVKKRSTKKAAIIFETKADEGGEAKPKVVRKRKTKEEKEAEAMPLAARTIGHKLFIGAHISSAGGVQNAPVNSVHIGANAFALFLKSQRKWVNPPLVDEVASSFHHHCKSHTYDQTKHVVPHGSYLVNLAHTDADRTKQAYDAFLDDLQRCERLGIKLYNFHPGVANSTNGDRAKAIAHLASNINRAHAATSSVVTLLENMAAGGNVLGSTFEDLRDTIALVDNKDRVGVCLDTCHALAAGWDLRTPEAFKATMDSFDEKVGMKYLKAMHINDSKAPFNSRRDLHANIGTGFLGLRAFHNVVNEPRFEGLPLILETPIEVKDADGNNIKDDKGKDKEDKQIWATEIKLLESLVGMDVESEEFLRLERELARKGEPERSRLQEQIDRKGEKEAKKRIKAEGKGEKGKKGKEESESELSDEEE